MNLPLMILLASIGLLSFLAAFFLGRKGYGQAEDRKYDILVDFPFEMVNARHPFSFAGKILFLAFHLCFPFAPMAIALSSYTGLTGMSIFLMALLLLLSLSHAGLLLVSPSKTKGHVSLALSSFLLGGFCSFFYGLLFFQFRLEKPELSYAISIILWVLSGLFLLLALNPKLPSWAKMKVVEDINGAHLEKPRPFILAFSEWLSLFLDLAFFIVSFIGLFLLYYL